MKPMVRRITSSIWRYKWLVALAILLGGAVGFLASRHFVQPQYVAKSRLWVELPSREAATQGPIQTGQILSPAAWIDLLSANAVLDPVVHDLRLHVRTESRTDSAALASLQVEEELSPGDYRFQVDPAGNAFTLSTAGGDVVQQGRQGEVVGRGLGFSWVPDSGVFSPGREIEFALRRPHDVSSWIASQIRSTSPVRGGNFILLEITGDNPVWLAAVLNGVANQFVEVAADLKRAQSEELTRLLEEQLQVAAQNLRAAEGSLQGFRVSTATAPTDRVIAAPPGLDATTGPAYSGFFGMQMQRDQLRQDREAIQRALSRSAGGELSVAALEVVPAVRASSELTRALGELTAKRAELRTMQNQFTDEYVPVQRLAQEVAVLEQQVIPRLASGVVNELRVREREAEGRLQVAAGEMREIPARSIEEGRLERDVSISSQLFTTLQQRFETARLAAISTVPDIRVLDPAQVPSWPVNGAERSRLFLMILGLSIGLAVGVPVLLDRVDPRLRYPEQVSGDMGLAILGAVPHVGGAGETGKRVKRDPTTDAVEAFREIRLNVAHAYGTAGPLLTTITSPGVGDGKSFVSCNLALAFADLGHRTLLIDGDIRRGQVHHLLGAVRMPGLTDYLSGTASAEEIVQPTAYASLDMIAGGTRMQAGPELLGSAAMASLIRDLKSRYSVILIDSPPLGAGVDPFILSTLTGHTMLVLRNGRTDREFARTKLEMLDRLPIRLLGAVLNDVPASSSYRSYGYLPGYEAENEVEAGDEPMQLERV